MTTCEWCGEKIESTLGCGCKIAVSASHRRRIYELEDINVLQGNRIDELTGVLKGLYIAVVCGLPLDDQLRRVRETVDTEEDKREPQEFKAN